MLRIYCLSVSILSLLIVISSIVQYILEISYLNEYLFNIYTFNYHMNLKRTRSQTGFSSIISMVYYVVILNIFPTSSMYKNILFIILLQILEICSVMINQHRVSQNFYIYIFKRLFSALVRFIRRIYIIFILITVTISSQYLSCI